MEDHLIVQNPHTPVQKHAYLHGRSADSPEPKEQNIWKFDIETLQILEATMGYILLKVLRAPQYTSSEKHDIEIHVSQF